MINMTSYGNSARLVMMFVLPMTPFCRDQIPAVCFYHLDDITYLHRVHSFQDRGCSLLDHFNMDLIYCKR